MGTTSKKTTKTTPRKTTAPRRVRAVSVTAGASAPPGTDTTLDHDQVAERAYLIAEREGWPQGRELAHWLQAEAELRDTSTRESN